MSQPSLIDPYLPSDDGGIPKTYPELIRQLTCTCAGGAQIKPSPPPHATVNIGDVIADHAGKLSALAAAYGIMAVIMQVISCIIDVLCAMMNPLAVIAAMIKLFGVCIPEFILILPQLAIPAKILCLIKIIIAIVEYIITVIIPLILDIIRNIQDLISAITTGNQDALNAVAFKITQLMKEILNALGILAALDAIILMIKTLIDAGFGLPCSGGGGSCSECGEDQCPSVMQSRTLTGSDGRMTILFGPDGFSYFIRFLSASNQANFKSLREFFPDGVDYSNTDDTDKVPYTLTVGSMTYIVAGVDAGGGLYLRTAQNPQLDDGYLSSVTSPVIAGVPTPVDAVTPGQYIRFGTNTLSFSSSDVNGFVEMFETNASLDSTKNSGTFKVTAIYDGYNAKLDGKAASAWDGYNTLDPNAHMIWRKQPRAPGAGALLQYTFGINHDELIRRSMIGLGCHPDVKAAIEGTRNRLPVVDDTALPDLPDVSKLIADATSCITSVVSPDELDTQWVLDNYGTLGQDVTNMGVCVADALNDLREEMVDYAEEIYPRIFDAENSVFSADKEIVIVGGDAVVTIIPLNIYGTKLAEDLPPGVIDVDAFTNFGTLSSVEEVVDATGTSTGEFRATVTSTNKGTALLTASVANIFISDFDENLDPPDLVTRSLAVKFVDDPSKVSDGKPADSKEPLGIAGR